MTQTTTTAEAPATITEQELFGKFLSVVLPSEMAGRKYSIFVRDWLTGFELDGLDEVFARLVGAYKDKSSMAAPTELLSDALYELRGAAKSLEEVLAAFKIYSMGFSAGIGDDEDSNIVDLASYYSSTTVNADACEANLPAGNVQTDRQKAMSRARDLGLTQAEIDAISGHGIRLDQ